MGFLDDFNPISAVGSLAGSLIGSHAAGNASDQLQAGAQAANTNLSGIWQQQQANNQPWMAAGTGALSQMQGMAAQAPSFTAADFKANMDPAYQFDLQQGQQALERSAAARGGLQSGGTLKDLTNYAQGAASHEYQNAYSRFMNNQNTQFGRLSSIAGMGQNATMNTNLLGANYANAYGNNLIGAANAKAAGTMAQGQIWSNFASGLGGSPGMPTVGNLSSMLGSTSPQAGGAGGMGTGAMNAGLGSAWAGADAAPAAAAGAGGMSSLGMLALA